MPGWKLAQDESIRQEIQIPADAALSDAEGAGDLGAVPGLGVVVRHHRPEAAQGLGRRTDPELREIALQKGLEEGAAPLEAFRLAGGEERPWKSSAQPEAVQRGGSGLVESQAVEPVVADPAGERFGGLSQEVRRGAAQHEELRIEIRPVDQHPEQREELGTPLDLVEDHEPSKRAEGQLRIGEQSQVRGALQIEAGHRLAPPLSQLTSDRRLADLTSAQDRDHGERPEKPGQALKVPVASDHSGSLP